MTDEEIPNTMKLAILSDIHGNLPALQAVMRDLAKVHVDQVVVAGDVINWGPFSAECFDIVAREGWPVIRGNNEFYLLDYNTPRAPAAWQDETQWPLLPWLRKQLQGRRHHCIAAWPDSISLRFADGPPIRLVHGSCRSPWESIFAMDDEDRTRQWIDRVLDPGFLEELLVCRGGGVGDHHATG